MLGNDIGVEGGQVLIPALENLGQLEFLRLSGLLITGASTVFVK